MTLPKPIERRAWVIGYRLSDTQYEKRKIINNLSDFSCVGYCMNFVAIIFIQAKTNYSLAPGYGPGTENLMFWNLNEN